MKSADYIFLTYFKINKRNKNKSSFLSIFICMWQCLLLVLFNTSAREIQYQTFKRDKHKY